MGRGLRWSIPILLWLLTPAFAPAEPGSTARTAAGDTIPAIPQIALAPAAADSARPAPPKAPKKKAGSKKKAGTRKAKKASKKAPSKKTKKASKTSEKKTAKQAEKKTTGKKSSKKAAKASSRSFPSRIGPFDFSGTIGLQTIYDNNIFRYSSINMGRARTGDYRPGEFDLKTFGDGIVSPRVALNFRARFLGRRQTIFRVGYIRWQYGNNPHKSNETWWLRLRQDTIGRDYAEAGYSYSPMSLIRPLGDRAPFDPFSTVAYSYYPFESTRNAFYLAYQRRMTDKWTTRLEGGRVIRYYNQRFIENDNWEWNGELTLRYALTRVWSFAGRYMYSDVVARAADTVGETRLTSNDGDPSYKRDLYEITVGLSPRRSWLLDQWEVVGQFMAYYFTSEQPYWSDNTHVGRKDEIYAWETTLGSKPVWKRATLEIGYRFTRRSSSSASSSDLEEDKNYHDSRTWLGMTYPF